jgi:hypothetical protein
MKLAVPSFTDDAVTLALGANVVPPSREKVA